MTTLDWRSPRASAWWNKGLRLLPWIVALGIAAKAFRAVQNTILFPLIRGNFDGMPWSYNSAQTQLNWLTTGFNRRELYNTIVGLVGRGGMDPMVSSAVVFLAFYLVLTIVLIWAVAKRPRGLQQIALMAASITLLLRLASDPGRTDIAIGLCGLVAAWAARSGRWIAVAITISLALTVYETGLIYLAPMVCAIAWEQRAWRDINWRSVAPAAAIMAIGLIIYVISSRAQLDVFGLTRQLHAQFPDPRWADLAAYANLGGVRTIRTAQCINALDPKHWLQVGAGVFLMALFSVCLRPQRWRVTLVSVLVPFFFLITITTDTGRWTVLALASILALALTQPAEEDRRSIVSGLIFAALALVGFQLMVMKVGPTDVGLPIPSVHALDRYPSLLTLPFGESVTRCDPTWRQSIGLPPA